MRRIRTVALARGRPPEGRARRTARLLSEEVAKGKLVRRWTGNDSSLAGPRPEAVAPDVFLIQFRHAPHFPAKCFPDQPYSFSVTRPARRAGNGSAGRFSLAGAVIIMDATVSASL